ncbi:MAG: HPF/RaiA family ribosome-associated protein [Candidatus Rokubacteria bacterium]|nr:HPF/RaiA family ribosome-associated protein [Candidatus Rokubacteria bacterium]
MQVIIDARGLSLSRIYRERLGRKLEKLPPLLPKIVEAKMVLSREKHRRTAGLTVIAKRHTFHSEETAGDLGTAVDRAVDALVRQVRTVKDRVTRRPPRARRRGQGPEGVGAREAAELRPEPLVVVRRVAPKPMFVEEAVEQFRLGGEHFLVFTNAQTEAVNVVYRRKDGVLGLIEPVA